MSSKRATDAEDLQQAVMVNRETLDDPQRARPQLLFLTQTLPFPADAGVNVRTYNILRVLSRTFDVTALCFFRKKERPTQKSVEDSLRGLAKVVASVEAFPIPQEHSFARLLADHGRSVISGAPYTRYAYASAPVMRRLRELLTSRHFDLIHVDSLDLSAYLPLFAGYPVACTHQNVESVLLARRAASEPARFVRWYLKLQARLTEREERNWCGRVGSNLAVSAEDAEMLKRLVPAARVIVVPNGVDTGFFEPVSAEENGIVFVGPHSWFPNREGMKFFAEEVLPLVRAGGINSSVTWIGRSPQEIREIYDRQHGITLTGFVPDIRPYVRAAACYVVPLRTGGGTRLKILDAWALGKAVVSTTVGCEGLLTRDGENILIRDEPQTFAEAVSAVLRDPKLRKTLGDNARQTALRHYDWEVIGETLVREYSLLLGATAQRFSGHTGS